MLVSAARAGRCCSTTSISRASSDLTITVPSVRDASKPSRIGFINASAAVRMGNRCIRPKNKARREAGLWGYALGSGRFFGLYRLAKLLHRGDLDLADALCRYAVLVAEGLQPGLFAVGQPAALQDIGRARVELRE